MFRVYMEAEAEEALKRVLPRIEAACMALPEIAVLGELRGRLSAASGSEVLDMDALVVLSPFLAILSTIRREGRQAHHVRARGPVGMPSSLGTQSSMSPMASPGDEAPQFPSLRKSEASPNSRPIALPTSSSLEDVPTGEHHRRSSFAASVSLTKSHALMTQKSARSRALSKPVGLGDFGLGDDVAKPPSPLLRLASENLKRSEDGEKRTTRRRHRRTMSIEESASDMRATVSAARARGVDPAALLTQVLIQLTRLFHQLRALESSEGSEAFEAWVAANFAQSLSTPSSVQTRRRNVSASSAAEAAASPQMMSSGGPLTTSGEILIGADESAVDAEVLVCRICEAVVPRMTLRSHTRDCRDHALALNRSRELSRQVAETFVCIEGLMKSVNLPAGVSAAQFLDNLRISLRSVARAPRDLDTAAELAMRRRGRSSMRSVMTASMVFTEEFRALFQQLSQATFTTDEGTSVGVLESPLGDALLKLEELAYAKVKQKLLVNALGSRLRKQTRTRGAPDLRSVDGMALDSDASRLPSIQDFDVIKPIARGGYGSVLLARKRRTGDVFAIKVIPKANLMRKNMLSSVSHERDIMAAVHSNPFVVRLYFSFQSRDNMYLVMDYMNGGDFRCLLENVGRLSMDHARFYFAELVVAVALLQEAGIVHRDLKPDNLLIDSSGHLHLADFGLSHGGLMAQQETILEMSDEALPLTNSSGIPISSETPPLPETVAHAPLELVDLRQSTQRCSAGTSTRSGVLGTPHYLSPEVLLSRPSTFASDWWACGCILYELLMGFPPFNGDSVAEVFADILSGEVLWPDNLAEAELTVECVDLVQRLLRRNPLERLGVSRAGESDPNAIMSHPFFDGIRWHALLDSPGPVVPPGDELDTSLFASQRAVGDGWSDFASDLSAAASSSSEDDALMRLTMPDKLTESTHSLIVSGLRQGGDFSYSHLENLVDKNMHMLSPDSSPSQRSRSNSPVRNRSRSSSFDI